MNNYQDYLVSQNQNIQNFKNALQGIRNNDIPVQAPAGRSKKDERGVIPYFNEQGSQ